MNILINDCDQANEIKMMIVYTRYGNGLTPEIHSRLFVGARQSLHRLDHPPKLTSLTLLVSNAVYAVPR
jgi:hypothetical protein